MRVIVDEPRPIAFRRPLPQAATVRSSRFAPALRTFLAFVVVLATACSKQPGGATYDVLTDDALMRANRLELPFGFDPRTMTTPH